jgi:hypothetical protein
MTLKRSVKNFLIRMYRQKAKSPQSQLVFKEYSDLGESIRNACYPQLRYKNENYYNSFPVYIKMVSIAYHKACRRILELGAGLSTILWGKYAHNTKATVCTVDADLSYVRSLLKGTPHEKVVEDHVECIQGKTITVDEFVDFYQDAEHQTFGGVEVVSFKETLDFFHDGRYYDWRTKGVEQIIGRKRWRISDLFFDRDALKFPIGILDIYSMGRSFENEVVFLDEGLGDSRRGVLDQLVKRGNQWDFIFFDSSITIGGIAAFHDVFFPKSLKNFLICASLLVDPNWLPLYFDDTTPQGLFMVQRIR